MPTCEARIFSASLLRKWSCYRENGHGHSYEKDPASASKADDGPEARNFPPFPINVATYEEGFGWLRKHAPNMPSVSYRIATIGLLFGYCVYSSATPAKRGGRQVYRAERMCQIPCCTVGGFRRDARVHRMRTTPRRRTRCPRHCTAQWLMHHRPKTSRKGVSVKSLALLSHARKRIASALTGIRSPRPSRGAANPLLA